MSKFSNGIAKTQVFTRRNWMCDIESYSKLSQKIFDDVNGDLRLRRVLKRAVERERAPQSLVDSIKMSIRDE